MDPTNPYRVTVMTHILDTFMLNQGHTSVIGGTKSNHVIKSGTDRRNRSGKGGRGQTTIMEVATGILTNIDTGYTTAPAYIIYHSIKQIALKNQNSNQNGKRKHIKTELHMI